LIVVLQHDVADDLATRVVAPLSTATARGNISRIRVSVEVNGAGYLVRLDRMAAIDKSEIGGAIANIADIEFGIENGLDFLFFGI